MKTQNQKSIYSALLRKNIAQCSNFPKGVFASGMQEL